MHWLIAQLLGLLNAVRCHFYAMAAVAVAVDDTAPLSAKSPGRKRNRNRNKAPLNAMLGGDGASVPGTESADGGAPDGVAGQTKKGAKAACLSRRQIGANWQQLGIAVMRPDPRLPTPPLKLPVTKQGVRITKHLALDCEMVGVGFAGKKHMLARVSIVNQMCETVMDRFVRPLEPVVDYRTGVSGIRPRDLVRGDHFDRVQSDVRQLLHNRILVGHAVYHDLRVLALEHPSRSVRDTSSYRPLVNRITGGATPSLKTLARCVLNLDIQEGEHSSVEDARATMRIYNRYQEEWERAIRRRNN